MFLLLSAFVLSFSANAQSNNFCTQLKTIADAVSYGKNDLFGSQLKKDNVFTYYQSKVKLSPAGRSEFSKSESKYGSVFFDEWVAEKTSADKANQVYAEYFTKLKSCLGEKFKESTPLSSGTKWAYYYSDSYELKLEIIKPYGEDTFSVLISVNVPEDY